MDGVQLAILNSRLDGVARKMANTLLRTGRSGILTIARDFSCCILTADDQLLASAESLPIHILLRPRRHGPDDAARTTRSSRGATRTCTTRPITAARTRPTTRS